MVARNGIEPSSSAYETDSRRLKEPESHANKPWPADILVKIAREATPEFRALIKAYLMTAQRGSDVTTWTWNMYDEKAKTLTFKQAKTGKDLTLHVPEVLAEAIELMEGRHRTHIFVTPRGKKWTTLNAQETLRTMLRNMKLPRYTLHGLRATGPTALKLLGFENRALRSLTGHDSDQNLETYLRGVDSYTLAKPAQEALQIAFSGAFEEAGQAAKSRKAAVFRKIGDPLVNNTDNGPKSENSDL